MNEMDLVQLVGVGGAIFLATVGIVYTKRKSTPELRCEEHHALIKKLDERIRNIELHVVSISTKLKVDSKYPPPIE